MTGTETAEPAEPLGGAEQVDSKERELTRSVKMLRDTQKQLSQATYDCSHTFCHYYVVFNDLPSSFRNIHKSFVSV